MIIYPLEIQPKAVSKTAAGNANQEEEDDGDECGYYYKSGVQPQVPITDRTTEHADTHEESDQETPVLSADGPVVEEGPITNTNEPETQEENMQREDDDHSEDIQPDEEPQDKTPVSRVQIQVKTTENRDVTYQGEKDEPLRSSPMTNLGLQHATMQHMRMKCLTSISPYYIKEFSQ